jgi:hypothetical protein
MVVSGPDAAPELMPILMLCSRGKGPLKRVGAKVVSEKRG